MNRFLSYIIPFRTLNIGSFSAYGDESSWKNSNFADVNHKARKSYGRFSIIPNCWKS